MKKHAPNNPWFASQLSDVELLGKLDTTLGLSANERRSLDAAMARFVEVGSLPRKLRDWAMAVAKVKGLLSASEIKPVPKHRGSLGNDGGDSFSTRVTPGTEYAEQILARRPLKPPGRAA
jgi:hypothetical protein